MTTDRDEQEWSLDLTSINEQVDSMRRQIQRLKDPSARLDLTKLQRNVENILTDISKEAVCCRGFNRTTGNMQNLQKTLNETVALLGKMLMLAALME